MPQRSAAGLVFGLLSLTTLGCNRSLIGPVADALARSGKHEEALSAYSRAIEERVLDEDQKNEMKERYAVMGAVVADEKIAAARALGATDPEAALVIARGLRGQYWVPEEKKKDVEALIGDLALLALEKIEPALDIASAPKLVRKAEVVADGVSEGHAAHAKLTEIKSKAAQFHRDAAAKLPADLPWARRFHEARVAHYMAKPFAVAEALPAIPAPTFTTVPVSAKLGSVSSSCTGSKSAVAGRLPPERADAPVQVQVSLDSCEWKTFDTRQTHTFDTYVPHEEQVKEYRDVPLSYTNTLVGQNTVCSKPELGIKGSCRIVPWEKTETVSIGTRREEIMVTRRWLEKKTETTHTGSTWKEMQIRGSASVRIGGDAQTISFDLSDRDQSWVESAVASRVSAGVQKITAAKEIEEIAGQAASSDAAGNAFEAEALYGKIVAVGTQGAGVQKAMAWFGGRYGLDAEGVVAAFAGKPVAPPEHEAPKGLELAQFDSKEYEEREDKLRPAMPKPIFGLGRMVRQGIDTSVAVRQSPLDKTRTAVTLRNALVIGDYEGFALRLLFDGELASLAGNASGFSTGGLFHIGKTRDGTGLLVTTGFLAGEHIVPGELPKEGHARIPLRADFAFFWTNPFSLSFDVGIDGNLLALTDADNPRVKHASPLSGGMTVRVTKWFFARGGVSLPLGIDASPRLGAEAGLHL